MKSFVFIILALINVVSYAQSNYSGIWKDTTGIFYSIHHTGDSILLTELTTHTTVLSPYQQGSVYVTDSFFDLAIIGYGFFILELENGRYAYTRNGHFKLNSEGYLVNEQGNRLVTEKNHSIISEMQNNFSTFVVSYNGSGFMSLRNDATGELSEFDRIPLAMINPIDLQKQGDLFISKAPDNVL